MGDEEKKKEKKKKSKKEDDDTANLISALTCAQLKKRLGDLGLKQSGLKSELVARLREADEVDRELTAAEVDGYEGLAAANAAAAADAAAAAATAKAAAAAASAAASPIATASYALPPIILDGRFKGYMSSRHVMELKLQIGKHYDMQAQHDFDRWQDDVTDGLPVQFMRRHMLLTAIRSKRTGVPSEPAATAAVAAADDTSAAAAAAAATAAAAAAAAANAAATTIARLEEHELGEMAAAAAAATAATAAANNAAAAAAAEEIARLQHEPGERTHWLRTAPTPWPSTQNGGIGGRRTDGQHDGATASSGAGREHLFWPFGFRLRPTQCVCTGNSQIRQIRHERPHQRTTPGDPNPNL
jgi:hypothetical protein